jgi:hypothetical protein
MEEKRKVGEKRRMDTQRKASYRARRNGREDVGVSRVGRATRAKAGKGNKGSESVTELVSEFIFIIRPVPHVLSLGLQGEDEMAEAGAGDACSLGSQRAVGAANAANPSVDPIVAGLMKDRLIHWRSSIVRYTIHASFRPIANAHLGIF